MEKISCKLVINSLSPHLQQLYTGFSDLAKKGIITLKVEKDPSFGPKREEQPIITAIINDKHTAIYDTLDGFNFIEADLSKNLEYLSVVLERCDFYFKRSYNAHLLRSVKDAHKVHPLGLNYMVSSKANFGEKMLAISLKAKLRLFIKHRQRLCHFLKRDNLQPLYSEQFEHLPGVKNTPPKILFLSRVWDPQGAKSTHLKDERVHINDFRAQCIRACRKEFRSNFFGGLFIDDFSRKHYADCLLPDNSLTLQSNFLKSVKQSEIGIATTGLHGSIGWKLAEYVAASRAIVSEKLNYEVPGNFAAGKNYLEFSTSEELIEKIHLLMHDKELLLGMMLQNYAYYEAYVKPERLVLNTLLRIVNS